MPYIPKRICVDVLIVMLFPMGFPRKFGGKNVTMQNRAMAIMGFVMSQPIRMINEFKGWSIFMKMSVYTIVDDFPVKTARVLVLDRDYEIGDYKRAEIDGKSYEYIVNYGFRTIILPNMAKRCFKGRMIKFIP